MFEFQPREGELRIATLQRELAVPDLAHEHTIVCEET